MRPDDAVPPGDRGQPGDPTPPEDAGERVGELLAAAGSDPTAMPPSVSARLDAVLSQLAAERPGETADGTSGVADLGRAEGRARAPRLWPRLLVAATVLSVAGVALGSFLQDGVDERATSGQGESADLVQPEPAQKEAATARERTTAPEAATESGADLAGSVPGGVEPGAELRTASLTFDVQQVEDSGKARPVAADPAAWRRACVRPATGTGDEWAPVTLDGEDAVLVLRAPAGGRRAAEVFTCDDAGTPARNTTVRAR